jgi:iron complex outermembrane receptor protein
MNFVPGWWTRWVAIALTPLASLPAAAADPATAGLPHPEAPTVLEEVVVTAQRRSEDLMQVPIAITALSGDRLEQLGALDLSYLSQISPHTIVETAVGTNNAIAAHIRGVGQTDHIAGLEAGVALYVDDVYYARPQSALLDLLDVERIEVLRGPQGTLYGRNAVGGAIRYITRRLGHEPELRMRARLGNYGMADGIVSATLPVGGTLSFGGTFASLNLDGFGDNLYLTDQENYNKSILTARFTAEWQPGENWFLRFAADGLEDRSDTRRGHLEVATAFPGFIPLPNVYDTLAGHQSFKASAEVRGWSLLTEYQATTNWTLRAIFASRADENWKPIDLDALPVVDIDVGFVDQNRQQTSELQALYNSESWHWVLGAFYLDSTALNVRETLGGRVPPFRNTNSFTDVAIESWALFGDLSHDFNERWSVSLGARYTEDRRHSVVIREQLVGGFTGFFGGSATLLSRPGDFEGTARFDDLSTRLTLQFHPADGQMLYATAAEGFKGGGFDPRGLSSDAPDFNGDNLVSQDEVEAFMQFEPEKVRSYELGWKGELFKGRLNSRLALFHADYTDIQISGTKLMDRDGDGIYESFSGTIASNDADAIIRGLEWEGQALAATDLWTNGSRLELNGALGYIDAEFEKYIDPEAQDIADSTTFGNAPSWTLALSARFQFPLSLLGHPGTLATLVSWSWRDEFAQGHSANPNFSQGAYALWDAGINWMSADGRWRAGLMGRNLGEARYIVSGLGLGGGNFLYRTVFYGNPRQYWLDLQYRFGAGP